MNNSSDKIFDISWGAIIKVFIVITAFYTIFLIKDLLIWFVFGVVLSIVFNPLIDSLEKFKIPRVVGVVVSYFSVFGLIGALIYFTIPIFISELQKLIASLPNYLGEISLILQPFGIEISTTTNEFFNQVKSFLQERSSGILSSIMSLFGGLSSTLFVFTIAMFLSMERNPIQKALYLIFPKKYENSVAVIWQKCKSKVTNWFVVRIIGMVFVGAVSYVSFSLLGIKYPLTLSLISGVLDFIPVIGPLIAFVIVFFMTLADNLFNAFLVALIFVLVQIIENNVLIPMLSDRFVGIPSVLVLISLAIGAKLFGMVGAILFVPLSAIIYEFAKEFLEQRKILEGESEQQELTLPLK
ncbi:AI-2 transport protein TqsA [bacterium HR34]|nr:AI-2 transport protein TqsA [bacterium HR34]